MPYYLFFWTPANEQHVADAFVNREEFEEVVMSPDRVDSSRSSGRFVAFGTTSTGKYIACVYDLLDADTIYPVTAFELED
jgi:hypothetical protein